MQLFVTQAHITNLRQRLRQTADPAERWAIGMLLTEESLRQCEVEPRTAPDPGEPFYQRDRDASPG